MKFTTQITLLALAVATATARETPSAQRELARNLKGTKPSFDFERQLKKDDKDEKDDKDKKEKKEKEGKGDGSVQECHAFDDDVDEIGEPLDPECKKVDKCVLKRTKFLLNYEPNFPKDRPDVYIQVEIGDGTRYQFYPDDYADWTAETYAEKGYDYKEKEGMGSVPMVDREIHQILYDEQEKLGGQGFKFRFVSKNGPGAWNSCKYSPIAFDLDNSGDVGMITRPGGFEIDITGDGDKENLRQWFAPTEGILIDKKAEEGKEDFKNGIITGEHMMGDMAGEYTDGFAKLATYDDNCDDKLTGKELDGLYIWIDANSNTLLDKGELQKLREYGIVEISTVHDDLKSHAVLEDKKGVRRNMLMQDLWFDTFEEVDERSAPKTQKKVVICVGTSDAEDPFHMLEVAESAVKAFMSSSSQGNGKTFDDCYPGDDVTINGASYKVASDCSLPGYEPASSSDEGPAPPAPDGPSPEDRTTEKAFTKGDPHFKTFGGEMYDYHGECDLVLLHNPDFKNGMGMDIHIRTKIEDFWSSVESAAIKLGDQTMEIKADPESNEWLWFNGKEASSGLVDGEWNRHQMAGFLVRYKQTGTVREANIYLKGAKEYMSIKTFKSFVRVDVSWQGSENYYNSVGLLGSHAHNGERLGRDGKFIKNTNAFGQEWQVRPEIDGSLFHSYEGAVVGKKCVMPPAYHEGDDLTAATLRGRRLGASALDTQAAEKACDHLVDPEEKKACVFDVIATQDLSMASTW